MKMYRPKRCEYNYKDENNSSNIRSDKNYQVSSKKFKQIVQKLFFYKDGFGIK